MNFFNQTAAALPILSLRGAFFATKQSNNSKKGAGYVNFIFCAALCFLSPSAQAETVIKFASLAPEGTAWMNAMRDFAKEASEKTGGEVKFKIYAGGVQGDEKDVVRKIRLGQLHAGGFTGVGIGEIAPQIRVLDAPFLFKSSEEVDLITKTFDSQVRKYFSDAGYVLLGWADVGFVHLFTNVPVTKPEDLKAVKMWIWEGDPIAEAAFRAMKIPAVPLSISDVNTSLQTGLLNGVYGSALSVVALQWHAKVKYMFTLAVANSAGAVLVSRKIFDGLSQETQKTLLSLGEKHFTKLSERSRKDNIAAVETLKKQGISLTSPASKETTAVFEEMGASARLSLAGRLYPKELLDDIEKTLRESRKKTK